MREDILFHVVFLSQIILVSFFMPRKMLNRIKYVFETYPPSKYLTCIRNPSKNTRKHCEDTGA